MISNVKEYGIQMTVGEQGKVRAGAQTLMGTTTFFPTSNICFTFIKVSGYGTMDFDRLIYIEELIFRADKKGTKKPGMFILR